MDQIAAFVRWLIYGTACVLMSVLLYFFTQIYGTWAVNCLRQWIDSRYDQMVDRYLDDICDDPTGKWAKWIESTSFTPIKILVLLSFVVVLRLKKLSYRMLLPRSPISAASGTAVAVTICISAFNSGSIPDIILTDNHQGQMVNYLDSINPTNLSASSKVTSGAEENKVMKPALRAVDMVSYGLGAVISVTGISGAKHHVDNPSSTPLGPKVGNLGAGSAFLAAPVIVGMLQNTGTQNSVEQTKFETISGFD